MSKIKIIFLSPVGYFKGGGERSLFDLVANPDIEPIILASEDGPILDKARELGLDWGVLDFASINKIHRPFSFMKGLTAFLDLIRAARALKKIAQSKNVNIVHSNGLKAHMINIIADRMGGAKSVIHIRDIPYTRPEKLVWKIMHALCRKMILVSHACWPGESLPRKAIVIHNGTPLINSILSTPKAEKLTIGFIGRIHPAKGLHLLIDWIAQADMDMHLSVRGTFSEDAPDYENTIKNLIKNQSLKDRVEFTGFINDPQSLYAGLDVVCVPSQTPDPLPRSVMESMARGIPVLGYPAGGIFEMIEDGKTGFLVKDFETFQRAIADIVDNPERLELMTKAARNKIVQEFTIEGLHNNVNIIYRALSA